MGVDRPLGQVQCLAHFQSGKALSKLTQDPDFGRLKFKQSAPNASDSRLGYSAEEPVRRHDPDRSPAPGPGTGPPHDPSTEMQPGISTLGRIAVEGGRPTCGDRTFARCFLLVANRSARASLTGAQQRQGRSARPRRPRECLCRSRDATSSPAERSAAASHISSSRRARRALPGRRRSRTPILGAGWPSQYEGGPYESRSSSSSNRSR
jgi:hypothetical protein